MRTAFPLRDEINQTSHWIIFLDRDQKNLGTCRVSLKRKTDQLSDLTRDEWQEFVEIVNKLENSLKKAFNATLFNWVIIRDKKLPSPKYHYLEWHVIPRYHKKIEFEKIIFEDPCFGKSTLNVCNNILTLPDEVMTKIIIKIRDNFDI
ncbi:MAG: HIT family protein [Euryarchaeota archaeon]|nr:HIT family protein [Euryarchaeota archaeon]MBV1729285.1 HIT family protein [Methanobacterium sp.]MBU4547329.1 HIT family protein [Euryarchaeota archaeon]MBU4608170.1 HIT family protein [Euryarchaeota archaeon]MBV1755689.1 HIT family protein [Methanobacterium sp.]